MYGVFIEKKISEKKKRGVQRSCDCCKGKGRGVANGGGGGGGGEGGKGGGKGGPGRGAGRPATLGPSGPPL